MDANPFNGLGNDPLKHGSPTTASSPAGTDDISQIMSSPHRTSGKRPMLGGGTRQTSVAASSSPANGAAATPFDQAPPPRLVHNVSSPPTDLVMHLDDTDGDESSVDARSDDSEHQRRLQLQRDAEERTTQQESAVRDADDQEGADYGDLVDEEMEEVATDTATVEDEESQPVPVGAAQTFLDKEASTTTQLAEKRLRDSDEVHISSVLHYARFSVSKVQILRGVIPHLLCVMLLTVSVMLGKDSANAVVTNKALAAQVFDDEGAQNAKSVSDAAAFVCESILPNIYTLDRDSRQKQFSYFTPDTTFPLSVLHDTSLTGIVSIRVHRGTREECKSNQGVFIPESERAMSSGSLGYDEETGDGCLTETLESDFGNASSSSSNEVYSGHSILGFLRRNYNALDKAVDGQNAMQIEAPLQHAHRDRELAKCKDLVALRQSNTLAIILEAIYFDSNTQSLMKGMYLFERRSSATRTTTLMYPYNVKSANDSVGVGFIFAVDVALAVLGLYILAELVHSIRLSYFLKLTDEPLISVVGWWDVYNAVYVCVFWAILGVKLYLWSVPSLQLEAAVDDSHMKLFTLLMDYHDLFELVYVGLSWLTMMAYLRTFMFLRFSIRLSVINETIGSSIHEMIGVWIILLMVFFAFGVAAVTIWGHKVTNENKSLYDAVVYLFIYLLNGEGNTYKLYEEADEISARIYFMLFFVLSWVVMLNVVVGVLALAFASVTETSMLMERPEWSPAAVGKDVLALVRRMPGPMGLSNSFTEFAQVRIDLVRAIDLWLAQGIENMVSGPEFISLGKLRQYTRRTFSPDFINHIFVKSTQQVGTFNARLRQLRLTNRAINNGVIMNTRLQNQAGLVERIHRKVVIQKRVDTAQAAHLMAIASPAYNVTRNDIVETHKRVIRLHNRHVWESEAYGVIQVYMKRAAALTQQAVDLLSDASANNKGKRPTSLSMIKRKAALGHSSRQATPQPEVSNQSTTAGDGAAKTRERGTSLFHTSSSPHLHGFAKQQLTPEEEQAQQRRREIRTLINEEGDARYDLRSASFGETQILVDYLAQYCHIARKAYGGFKTMFDQHIAAAQEIRLRLLERRRESDDALRAERLAIMERKKAEALAALEQQTATEAAASPRAQTSVHFADIPMVASPTANDPQQDSHDFTSEDMFELQRGVSASMGRQGSLPANEPLAHLLPRTKSSLKTAPDGSFQLHFDDALKPKTPLRDPMDSLFRRPERQPSLSSFALASMASKASLSPSATGSPLRKAPMSPHHNAGGIPNSRNGAVATRSGSPPPKMPPREKRR